MSAEGTSRPIVDAEPAQRVDSETGGAERARRGSYQRRFAAVYLALAVIAGAAIGAFVVLLARPDPAPTPRWSTFEPEGSTSARLHQIVNTIPQKYRRKDGSQLVSVAVSTPQAQVVGSDGQSLITVPVGRIAVEEGGDFHVVEGDSSLQYTLCGNGRDCVIDTGTPSTERFALVQRQALELALYTFKYLDDVTAVTVLLPPSFDVADTTGSGTPELRRTALFLRRDDVRRELDQPLIETLTPKTPRIGETRDRDLSAIVRLSQPHIYSYSLTQTQDGAFMYVFKPQVG
jgi:hypothetical protein